MARWASSRATHEFEWRILFVAGMWFQDLFNYDFRRTEMCIIPYGTQMGEISFCAYNTGVGIVEATSPECGAAEEGVGGRRGGGRQGQATARGRGGEGRVRGGEGGGEGGGGVGEAEAEAPTATVYEMLVAALQLGQSRSGSAPGRGWGGGA